MKRIALSILLWSLVSNARSQIQPSRKDSLDSFYILTPVEVRAIRANAAAPFTTSNLSKADIQKINLGQDIPFVLNQTPSVVVNSDAGNGIGYTGVHIRGTDGTRINVTLNGIPYNDAEGQATFFVDLPDFSSSAGSIQIQRGVGTSSNGTGAFGASINFSTNEDNVKSYAMFNNSAGSFNTWKNTLKAGTGLLGGHFTADLRLSSIRSDGYIDRASSNLRSLHFSTAYLAKKTTLRFNIFLGKEKTYQAWYGISEEDLKAGHRRINYAGTEKPGAPYNNETDNYWQDHYQLFLTQLLGKYTSFNTAFFYTKGKGYYEEYKADEDYADYGLPYPTDQNNPVLRSDFIRRLWLDNDFYGNIFSFQYKKNKEQATLGGGYTRYAGQHFGQLTWASNGLTGPGRWYDLDALKTDFNLYAKGQREFANHWFYFIDLQYRHINYDINGFEDHPSLIIKNRYDFFNPKAGISYLMNGWKGYLSYGIANKEPNRDDFEASINKQPVPEHLRDIELGIQKHAKQYSWGGTIYYMQYKDQLVLTGKINDVGAYTRTNIPYSYRLGIEIEGQKKLNDWLNIAANLTFSRNKVHDFSEYIDDYDNGGQKVNHYTSTDIAFSPSTTGGMTIQWFAAKKLEVDLINKYVGKQYLDNTQNENRTLHSFFVQDLRILFTINRQWMKEMNIIGQLNNLFNIKYEPNGYTYNYISSAELVVNNYYFPMAGTNFMLGVNISL